MARKNALITVALSETGLLTFTVGNAGKFDLDRSTLASDIREKAEIHGLVQKVSDAAAIAKDDLKGKSPDEIAATKFEAMKSVADRLISGEWSKRSGDGSSPVAGIIYRAFEEYVTDMAAKRKKTAPAADAIRARYDAMSRAEQLALRNIPEVATIMERIRAERGSKSESKVDTSGLLKELGL